MPKNGIESSEHITVISEETKGMYSQKGEDEIIASILLRLGDARNYWCVEFGAADGLTFSNTRRLVETCGYSGIWIESDRRFYKLLLQHAPPSVVALNYRVGFTESDGLDAILGDESGIPLNFDLLSIDIDGNDYHVWKAINKYRPRVVAIEFNPTIPTEVLFVQEADHSIHQGASLAMLIRLGKEKGYELVACTKWNAFFVDRKYFSLFGIANNSPYLLREHTGHLTYIFTAYDGTIYLAGNSILPWHDSFPISEERLQVLPRILRKYPASDYSRFHYFLLWLLKNWRKFLDRF